MANVSGGTGGPGNPPVYGVGLTITLDKGGTEYTVRVTRRVGAGVIASSQVIRIYYVPESSISQFDMAGKDWFARAQSSKRFVGQLSFANNYFMFLYVPVKPYADGGWFYAVSTGTGGTGEETQASAPVKVPRLNTAILVPGAAGDQVINVSVVMVNIGGIIKMTFRWQLPNVVGAYLKPLGALDDGYIQIWIWNYENRGDYRQFAANKIQAKTTQYEEAVSYYIPDFDGLHNVKVYFVGANSSYMYKEPFWDTVSPGVLLVGGIGP